MKFDKVELGCGESKPEGFLGVDKLDTSEADKVFDLDQEEWPLPSNHFNEIRARDLYEHLENPINFFEEIHRISKAGAKVWIRTPHRSSQNWTDPTHKRLAGLETISKYFTEDGDFAYYSEARFHENCVKIKFRKRKVFFYNYLIEPLVNLSFWTQFFYENTFLSRLFPAQDIEFELEVLGDGVKKANQKLEQLGEQPVKSGFL